MDGATQTRSASGGFPLPTRIGAHDVLGLLGRGSAGEILLARTRGPHGFSRLVAIKRLGANVAGDAEQSRALAREAVAYARLSHPTILRLYEFIEHEGRPALVLEYVDGSSLKRLRTRLAERGDALPDACALYVMANVFAALAAAHGAHDLDSGEPAPIIHRDISPANILIARDGSVKLADFGIARLAGVEHDTRAGMFKGTLGYMAPEQVLGGTITPRADVYSACLLLRELLLGRPTFDIRQTNDLALLRAMAHPTLPRIETLRKGVPRAVADLLAIGLSPSPDDRWMTARDAHAQLMASVDVEEARRHLTSAIEAVQARPLVARAQDATLPDVTPSPPKLIPLETPAAIAIANSLPAPPLRPTFPPSRVARWSTTIALFAMTATIVAFLATRRSTSASTSTSIASTSTSTASASTSIATTSTSIATASATIATASARIASPSAAIATTSATIATASARIASPSAAIATTSATLEIPATPPLSHRIFLDGRVLTESSPSHTTRISIRCGAHEARIGSHGVAQSIDVACGDSVVLKPRWSAH